MDAVDRVDHAFERALEFIRARVLLWLLNLRMGKMGEKFGQWTILLFFSCFIRPIDLTGESSVRLPFRRFGFFYALAPAGLYGLANVEMLKHFGMDKILPPPADTPFTSLIFFLGMNKIIHGLALLMILSATYLFGVIRWAYHQVLCRLLGPTLAKVDRATLGYFLLKSCGAMAVFSLFAWIVVFIK